MFFYATYRRHFIYNPILNSSIKSMLCMNVNSVRKPEQTCWRPRIWLWTMRPWTNNRQNMKVAPFCYLKRRCKECNIMGRSWGTLELWLFQISDRKKWDSLDCWLTNVSDFLDPNTSDILPEFPTFLSYVLSFMS